MASVHDVSIRTEDLPNVRATNTMSGVDESRLISLEDLPLRHVTSAIAPEDMPLETIDAYVLKVRSKDVASVCAFLKAYGLDAQPALKHLRRVKRDPAAPEPVQVLICPTSLLSKEELVEKLIDCKHISHIDAETLASPSAMPVPAHPARTMTQMKEWTANVWPVALMPIKEDIQAQARTVSWSAAKVTWMRSMCEQTAQSAQAAREQGEHGIACIVSETWDPARHSLSAEQLPIILATAHDKRKSTGNPLSHTVLNLLEEVAHLDRTGTRPALADSNYLLTNLTVFMTHEPCLLCSMALLHSRIACLVYIRKSEGAGGCGTEYGLHEQQGTNHHFEAWCVKETGDWQDLVAIVPAVELDP